MYNIAESGAKGGLNMVAKRITEIEDHKKERIIYTDTKNMLTLCNNLYHQVDTN